MSVAAGSVDPMQFRCWLVAVVILMLSTVTPAGAGQSRIIGDPARDVRQTMQARKLLLADPELARINIGVIVRNRVAVLWGPVPSAEVAFKAELCVRTMIELVEIRNELFVSELLEPIRTPLKIDIPPLFLPDHTPPKLPVEPRPILGAPGLLMGQDKAEAKNPLSQPTLKPKKTLSEVKVLPPATLPKLGLPQADVPRKLAEPPGMTETERELAAAIRTFLQSKSTFGSVQFAVKDRRVYLKAADQDSDALHEAARGIARLPNVEGVVLPDKTSPR
jgi:osmotically-inducible protein OsmY